MRIPEDDMPRLESLAEQRRRLNDDLDLLVQRLREGSVPSLDKVRLECQHLLTRQEKIFQDMIGLLRW